ncbi:LOW QUALITY PROTEIN: hypothetical protein OSB04_012490 [Centaurea solstitialis]|uniref:CCHC-type domain-containing protein n=1 Tax=Centaurea solstitialis TaxID=347529 RepID=A0AA38TM40_9ASTR|nr:LOW QUALITY PROTEIN: hypothetical protein OSB04_012490 [Centaurea solstitialis]
MPLKMRHNAPLWVRYNAPLSCAVKEALNAPILLTIGSQRVRYNAPIDARRGYSLGHIVKKEFMGNHVITLKKDGEPSGIWSGVKVSPSLVVVGSSLVVDSGVDLGVNFKSRKCEKQSQTLISVNKGGFDRECVITPFAGFRENCGQSQKPIYHLCSGCVVMQQGLDHFLIIERSKITNSYVVDAIAYDINLHTKIPQRIIAVSSFAAISFRLGQKIDPIDTVVPDAWIRLGLFVRRVVVQQLELLDPSLQAFVALSLSGFHASLWETVEHFLTDIPVETPGEATRISEGIHVTLRRSHACNKGSGTLNCREKADSTRRRIPTPTSGMKGASSAIRLLRKTAETLLEPRADPFKNLGVKIDIPEFDGRAEPDTVERIFDLRDIPDKYKVKLVAIKSRKYASLWREHIKKKRAQEGRSKVRTWEKMKKLLREKFLPPNFRQEAFLEYHNLSQRSTTVEELICEFDRLRMRCGAEEEEEQIIARFLGALRPEIVDIVRLQPYWSFNDVCQLSLKVEKQLRAKGKAAVSRSNPIKTDSSKGVSGAPTGSRLSSTKSEGATSSNTSTVPSRAPPRCFKSGGLGHFARECPNTQLVTLTEETTPVYDTEEDTPKEDETEIVDPDKGESFIAQRVLSTNPTRAIDDNLWLRNNIFRTRCTVKGKVCTIIIDGGSCENMVATVMVEKLGLKVEPHPEPYQLTWLKKGNVVKVKHRCLVQFSIGTRYSDEVWCEVVPMDVCHILLGRPWQYDRRTKHDGFLNTYTFKKEGVNVQLVPLDARDTGTEALVLTKSAFLDFTRASKPSFIFALLITETNQRADEPPPILQPLLTDFKDVFPADIPTGLPLVREIQHCIDFIPGATLPNKPTYRMNPTEYEELHRQVTELLDKRPYKRKHESMRSSGTTRSHN